MKVTLSSLPLLFCVFSSSLAHGAHENKQHHIPINPSTEIKCVAGNVSYSPGYLMKLAEQQRLSVGEQSQTLCQTCRDDGRWSYPRPCFSAGVREGRR